MRKTANICTIAAIILWAVALFALLMTVLGTRFVPTGYNYVSVFDVEGNGWLLPTWTAAVGLVAVGIVLCIALRKREHANWLPLIVGIVGAVVALVVALEMKAALPAKAGTHYTTQGLTAWRLIWRHFSPVAAGVLVSIAARLHHTTTRDLRVLAENEAYKEHYDLSGDPVFAESESTIGLDTYAEDFGVKKPARRLKRSLRKRKNP